MDQVIKVLIVDDHKLISEAWSSLLREAPGIQVIGTADNVEEAYDKAVVHKPEIVLMDINLGAGSGFDATEKINNTLPKTRVIGLSLHDDITYVKKFLSIGAKGYLTKNTSKTELIEAIHAVQRGDVFIGSDIKDRYFTSLLNVDSSETKKRVDNEGN
jgi:DNA-binding NarL/FixJ family response regulator